MAFHFNSSPFTARPARPHSSLLNIAVLAVASLALHASCLISRIGAAEPEQPKDATPAFSFADVKYFHRWSKDDQHEFTPEGQADLEHWADMVTINQYPKSTDGESLALMANATLENYKKAGGKIARTKSVPRTKDKPAEHLIVVVFGRPDFAEAAFARFKMLDGKGASIVYSHRFYGKDSLEKMRDWLTKNSETTEKNLMTWDEAPKVDGLK